MALFTLSTILFTVYGCIACCISYRSRDGGDQGHEYRYQESLSRPSYGAITTQPTYQPRPSPPCTRDSYPHTDSTTKTPTVSRLNRILPPQGGQFPRVTSHFAPLASPSSGDPQPEVPTVPRRREAVHGNAPLSSLVILPNVTFVSPDYDTVDDLREKALHMKRGEQEAYKRAKHAREKQDYSAEDAHNRDAIRQWSI